MLKDWIASISLVDALMGSHMGRLMIIFQKRMQIQQSIVLKSYLGSVRIFWLNYQLILERLKDKMSQVAILPEISEVWLFGSLYEMRAVPGSDLDILIIIDETDVRFFDRIERYQDLFSDIEIGVDIFPYTKQESDAGLARQAKNKGLCIFSREDPDMTEKAFNLLYSRLLQKYRKSSKYMHGCELY